MYIILVYDVDAKRCGKMLKICRKYLHHIQNSVFEGELTDSQIFKLRKELSSVMDERVDSVIIFRTRDEKWLNREIIGSERRSIDNIL